MKKLLSIERNWIESFPAHWKMCRLKDYTSTNRGITFTKADFVESGNAVLSYGQIHAKNNIVTEINHELIRFIPDSLIEDKSASKVKFGDFIFADTSEDLNGCGNCIYINESVDLYAGYHTILLRNKGLGCGKYFAYLFMSDLWRSQIRKKVKSVKLYSVTQGILNQSFIIVPPVTEQETIVAFLDKECGKIGEEIGLLERKVDCYRRLKHSLINRAITRGLASNVSLRPSGLRWMPYIPAHWKIGRVRDFFEYRNEKVSETDFPPLSVTKNGVVPQMDNVAKSLAEGETRKKVCKDDFVVNSRSDRKGSCGTSPLDGSVSLIYIVLKPKDILPNFVNYYFHSNDWIEEFYRNGKGIVADLWTTNYVTMRNIEIATPPIQEQHEIVAYLDDKCNKIDAIIKKTESKIELLKELKRSLINEVVTGQRAINISKS